MDGATGNESVIDQQLLIMVNGSNSMVYLTGSCENCTVNLTFAASPTTVLTATSPSTLTYLLDAGRVQIPLYSVLFLLAVIGNSLVILTLVQNKRMRTITNLFLLNLAVSDLFLGVFCMPFTLVGTLLRDFVFGEVMCKLLPYLQASSVAVSAWTLVIISVERYYAICHPLRSRRWQTLSHAYRLIGLIWCGSLFFMLPIAALSKLIPTNQGHHKCRELWFDRGYERAYNLFLDVILLVLPLAILAVTYSLITRTLCRGMHDFKRYSKSLTSSSNGEGGGIEGGAAGSGAMAAFGRSFRRNNNNNRATDQYMEVYIRPNGSTKTRCPSASLRCHRGHPPSTTPLCTDTAASALDTEGNSTSSPTSLSQEAWNQQQAAPTTTTTTTTSWPAASAASFRNYCPSAGAAVTAGGGGGGGKESLRMKNPALRKSNMEKSLMNKKRIIKMLFVVVLEFFLCWTPLYVINTMALFWPSTVYHNLGYTAISFFQLLAYSSSCCNPITYCFMSGGFRKAFLNLFRCFRPGSGGGRNRRNSAMCGMMYVSGGGGSSTRHHNRRAVTNGSSSSHNKNNQTVTMDTVLSNDGVVSLQQRNRQQQRQSQLAVDHSN
ncbi:cholecystokinin receptor type A-like [Culex pipiens pallens]|uniref:cholecystokinin receptor type A-like n=1 Tax=Culex pipiens pallens TaxID=42434 RepID=UPI001953FCA6|nr:cholecystokinin receptor type A-like [Culex pipiens pallens]